MHPTVKDVKQEKPFKGSFPRVGQRQKAKKNIPTMELSLLLLEPS